MRSMWAPPSIRALVFMARCAVVLFNWHVQMKCFLFRGGTVVIDIRLEPEVLDTIPLTLIIGVGGHVQFGGGEDWLFWDSMSPI